MKYISFTSVKYVVISLGEHMSTNVVVDRLRARRCGKHRTEPALVGPPYKLYRPLNWQEVHC